MLFRLFFLSFFIQPLSAQIFFGDDSSPFALDGECDDPRFKGNGMASTLLLSDIYRDATDCSTLYYDGQTSLLVAPEFGDDSSPFALDGECDDPRFQGTGMARVLREENTLKDASDCMRLFNTRMITNSSNGYLNFGDDSSPFALDGECDDPRFKGNGMASTLLLSDIYRDATDCSTLYYDGQTSLLVAPEFGDDSSPFALDGECDDPRFQGTGMARVLREENTLKDASDCMRLFNLFEISQIND
ncbi:MAG: hypothetical protein ACO2ZB_02115 [Gammaproteobacteria bacterium]